LIKHLKLLIADLNSQPVTLVSKKLINAILLAAFLALAGYFLFNWYRGSSAAWKYIPSNAVVVITSEHLQDSSYTATDALIDLKRLPLLDIASDNLSLLNLIAPDAARLHAFLKDKAITYSYHPRTSTEWGVIMYIPLAGGDKPAWLDSPRRGDVRVLHHNFQNQKITDVSDVRSRPLFSYLIKDNYLAVSYYGDLIEDVVRASSLSIESFQLRYRFAKIPDSDFGTSIYLKSDAWKSIVPLANEGSTLKEFAKAFPDFQDYHIEKTEDKTNLNLTSSGSKTPDHYFNSWLQDSPGSPFTGHKHISQQTSFFYRLAVSDEANFKKEFVKWHKKNNSEPWNKLNYYIGKESNLLVDNLGSELVLCQLEENNSINDGKILLARFSNYDKLRPVLQKLARLSNKEMNVSSDQFQGYDIYSVDIPELPVGLYGPMFTGFQRSYITYVAPYLVISNNAQVLQNYIVDYENQLTWKQSPEFDSVLINDKSEAQLSLIVNLRKAQSRSASTAGKSYGDLTSKIESAVIQCHFEGNTAYPEISLIPKKRQTLEKVLNRTFLNIDIEMPVIYDTELAALQNPVDGSSEILLTDIEHNLLRTDNLKTGKTETITKLDGPIVTTAYKVDFLNIGRQQRIFATSNAVYAIDEDDSTTFIKFSKTIPSVAPISALYLVDGGEDGSNRFVIRTSAQELFLWESVNKPIRKLNRSVRFENIQAPVVTLNQIGNRGFIVTEKNGKIYLLGENGAVKPGFPVDILARTESPFTWAQNTETGQPELVGVSASGDLIRINLSGKITSRRQLLRPEPGSTFRIVFDRNSLDWILARSSASRASIITKEGNELFTIKDIKPNSEIQYHFFGVDNRFITIRSGNYTTLFDMTGRRLGDKAIPSEMPVKLTYQPGYYKLLIFSRSEKKIQVWSIKLR
jgi:3-hydroxymyristoyl/3-hydroxydecanoyl-(acyl carrier protein) dehydratase